MSINFVIILPLSVLGIFIAGYRQSKVLRYMFTVILGIYVLVNVAVVAVSEDIIDSIPHVRVEHEEFKLAKGGTVYLSWKQTLVNSNKFYINEGTRSEDIEGYLNRAKKNIHLIVCKEDDVLYSSIIGTKDTLTADIVEGYYKAYIRDGSLPNPRTKYIFSIFYLYV